LIHVSDAFYVTPTWHTNDKLYVYPDNGGSVIRPYL